LEKLNEVHRVKIKIMFSLLALISCVDKSLLKLKFKIKKKW